MVGVPGKVYPELAEGNPGFQIEKMLQGKEGHYIYMIRLSSFLLLLFPVLTTNVPHLFPKPGMGICVRVSCRENSPNRVALRSGTAL